MKILRLSGAGLLLGAALLATYPSLAEGPPVTATRVSTELLDDWARESASTTFREFVELLGIPNDQQIPEDIQKSAAWLEAAFARRGFMARQIPNEGRPMVFAEYPGAKASRKTVLFYLHLDGQPVTASEWKQDSPWKATLKRRTPLGAWEILPINSLFGKDVDPEWRIFARSSSDDKGPILMLLAAVDAIRQHGLAPSVNFKVILDSQEERNSPSISRVVAEDRAALRTDAVVIIDGPKHETNRPTLMFGNRGLVTATLKVFGSRNELHSGHYGNYAPNPAQRLATLLASMKDDNGRVTIPGFYDGVVLDEPTRKLLSQVPDDEAALQRRLGIGAPDKVGGSYQEALQYPSLNVRGILAADVGAKVRTVIPESAVAEIDIRTVPEAAPNRLQSLMERHIQAQGYYLVKGNPSDEERATHPRLASLTFADASSQGTAARTDIQAPVGQWLMSALRKTFGRDPIRIRTMGGTVPTRALVDPLGAPFVILPLVNPDNNQHAGNENLRIGNYFDGVKSMIGILTEPF